VMNDTRPGCVRFGPPSLVGLEFGPRLHVMLVQINHLVRKKDVCEADDMLASSNGV
jgi:hypothetical protein